MAKTEAKRNTSGDLLCPQCSEPMRTLRSKMFSRSEVFNCPKHGDFRLIKRRKRRVPDMDDSRNWKATCSECGGIMDYFNLRYGCRKCGNILEV